MDVIPIDGLPEFEKWIEIPGEDDQRPGSRAIHLREFTFEGLDYVILRDANGHFEVYRDRGNGKRLDMPAAWIRPDYEDPWHAAWWTGSLSVWMVVALKAILSPREV